MVSLNTKPQQDELTGIDRELADLPPALRWREWMNRVEAVIFASSEIVLRDNLQRVVSQTAQLDLLIADIQSELKGRPYELAAVAGGWIHRTRPQYSDAIRAAADLGDSSLGLSEMEMAVLTGVAYHQPINRTQLNEMFGQDVSRDVLNRLRFKELIANGPRSPGPGAAHTFVTTPKFLATFDLQNIRDLPELDELIDQPPNEKQVIFI